MKYFYDLEFFEDGSTISPISIGVCAEDGRRYYAVASDAPYARIRQSPWMRKNVLPHLPHQKPTNWARLNVGGQDDWMAKNFDVDMHSVKVRPTWVIANELFQFFAGDVELWADYGAYDHVCLMQFWGSMMKKPSMLPMYTNDLQQLLRSAQLTDDDWYASDVFQGLTNNPGARPSHVAINDAEEAMLKHHWATTLVEGRAADAGMQAWQDGNRAAMQSRPLPVDEAASDEPKPLPPGVNGALLWAVTRAYGSTVDAEGAVDNEGEIRLVVRLADMDRATKTQVRPSDGLDALVLTAAPPAPLQEPTVGLDDNLRIADVDLPRVSIHEAELPGGMLIRTTTLPEPKEDPETEEEIAQKEGY